MMNNDDELKYKDVIETLKSLQKVTAPKNFETKLQKRINSQIVEKKKPFWEKFFIPSRLVPSAALAISAVVLFFILTNNSDSEDPLLMEPKIRQDVISSDGTSEISLPEKDNMNRLGNERIEDLDIAEFRDEVSDSGVRENNSPLSFTTAEHSIDKKGLNFRQVNLSKEEQESLNHLKAQFTRLLESSKNN